MWQRERDMARRSLVKRVAVTTAFTTDDLVAIGAAIGTAEPSPTQIRRFMATAINKALTVAKERYETTLTEESDVSF